MRAVAWSVDQALISVLASKIFQVIVKRIF